MYPNAYQDTWSSHYKNNGEETKLIEELADSTLFRYCAINLTAGFIFLFFQRRRVKENPEESNGNKTEIKKSEG